MKKQEKDYTVQRIKKIRDEKSPACTCKPPCIETHIKKSALTGGLKFKPIKQVVETYANEVINDNYRSNSIHIRELFREPQSYLTELAAFKKAEAAIQSKVEAHHRRFQTLIDQVELNKFDNGEDAIKAAMKLA